MKDSPHINTQELLEVSSYEELRDQLPHTTVFDMVDCAVQIYSPYQAPVDDLHKITAFLESVINVTDLKITPDDSIDRYAIYINSVPVPYSRKKSS